MSTEEPWRRATGNKLDKPDNNSGWRRSTNNNNNNNGGRPKLNLSKRGEAKQVEDKGDDGKVEDVTEKVENVALSEEKKESQRNQGKRERRFREPEVVNSRAAMLGEAAAPRKEVSFYVTFENFLTVIVRLVVEVCNVVRCYMS